ncbi:MAG: 2-C-methyl-D-erythritol 4-phosphate cytidylyltransferase [Bacteroides sp.]|nr:2-C-methyl-D-erythritol 4-phosphate cytidylyltransferase [Roseburia sp.]MCM1347385.1 2-C-methyl-D-erythritol 4-phosphate cytidylyltransferase [Bacteroides sp.]MCM1419844.1 2-C-methyl-D-erythritol 4-phosphate cytidylyltransferase [Bacteroides sp.]
MKQAVIIVAGGKGTRMGSDVPKQFMSINGKPILMHTLTRFHLYNAHIQIILVLPKDQQEYWKALCNEHKFHIEYTLADGGETRFHSVKNGIEKVKDNIELIGVHDGVRPFVSNDVIEQCYQTAAISGAAIPVIDMHETLRHICQRTNNAKEALSGKKSISETSVTVPRAEYKLVQTPQVFSSSILRAAYSQPYTERFTDDASVVESAGHDITLVPGNRENIKITTPYDIKIAGSLV